MRCNALLRCVQHVAATVTLVQPTGLISVTQPAVLLASCTTLPLRHAEVRSIKYVIAEIKHCLLIDSLRFVNASCVVFCKQYINLKLVF
jgi:hypothetical protein